MKTLGIALAAFAVVVMIRSALVGQDSADFDWKAFHRANDREWSYRTGMPPEDVRRLRLAAGVKDDEESNPIDWIDNKTLRHGRILLVTAAGSGHCLTVAVYAPHGRGFREVWSASEMPEGAGFCHPSLCRDATARAEKKDRIVVVVPGQLEDAEMGVCDVNTVLTYQGTGKTYALTKNETLPAPCMAEDYIRGLTEAFAADHGSLPRQAERLVTVQRVPGFGVESAIAIEKGPNGIQVNLLKFREPLRRHLDIYQKRQTPSQCLAEAKSFPVDEAPLNISQPDAERLVDELGKIGPTTEKCARRADGTCAQILDGTVYTVIFHDGRIEHLAGVAGLKGVRSENPALLAWIEELMRYVRTQTGKQTN